MTRPATALTVTTIETPSLGDRSYLVHDGACGVVIDPQRDLDRALEAIEDAGVRLTHVFETHVHNDYVSGGLALARRTGAVYVTSGDDDARFERHGVHDGASSGGGDRTSGTISDERVDNLGGAGVGDLDEVADGLPRRAYPVSDFPGLARELLRRPSEVSVVDVRRHDEWSDGHIDGAHNVALHELLTHLHHVPGGELWVHCDSGYRASIAASLLDRAGFSVVLIDADFDAASAAGLDIEVS